jgi:carbamate kinase
VTFTERPDADAAPRPLVVVAMGGHAFLREGAEATIEEHQRNADRIAKLLMTLVERRHDIVLTHGNGPQVGALLLQQERSRKDVPPMPLDVLVGMTEGSLGAILQQSLLNELRPRGIERWVVTMVTQVLVDSEDPAFGKATKPIGPVLSREQAERMREELGLEVGEQASGGWRRVVPSPRPRRVIQHRMIRDAALKGHIVIAAGGGGIPLEEVEDGRYRGVEAVVDKDLTSSVLATAIDASLLVILTTVPNVCVNFGTKEERPLGAVTVDEMEALQEEGHFPAGSMGPKIEGVIDFLRSGGKRALITDPESLPRAIEGRAGTHVVGRI